MANTFKPIVMKDIDLVLGADEATGAPFKCQVQEVTLEPNTNIVKEKALCPEGTYAESDTPEWELKVGYLVGEDSDAQKAALADWLFDNQGDKVTFWFRPRSKGRGWKGTVTVVPGPVGGSQGQFMKGSVTLPLDGQPVQLPAVVTP